MPHKMDVEIVLKASQNYNYCDYHDSCFFTSEASFLLGSLKHFFEAEVGYDYGAKTVGVYGRLGYRYIVPKGLLLKGGL